MAEITVSDVSELAKRFKGEDDMITITLEDDEATYSVQKALLCTASPYFSKALDGSFAESRQRALRLPGCDSFTFELFLCWLCRQGLPAELRESWHKNCNPRDAQLVLIRLWCFADAYLLPSLQNSTMYPLRLLIRSGRFDLTTDMAKLAVEIVPRSSKLWLLVTRSVARDYNQSCFDEEDEEILHSLPDIMVSVAKLRREF